MKMRALSLAVVASLLTATVVALGQSGPGVNNNFAVVWNMVWEASTVKPSYSASAGVTLASSATDVCTLQGSATKTIRVRRVILDGAASAVSTEPVAIIKRSTVDTAGTSAILTGVPYDSQSAAATAVAETYTVNGTLGTAVGTIADPMLGFANKTTGTNYGSLSLKFGELASSVVLRASTDQLVVNLNSLTVSGGQLVCTFEWTEE